MTCTALINCWDRTGLFTLVKPGQALPFWHRNTFGGEPECLGWGAALLVLHVSKDTIDEMQGMPAGDRHAYMVEHAVLGVRRIWHTPYCDRILVPEGFAADAIITEKAMRSAIIKANPWNSPRVFVKTKCLPPYGGRWRHQVVSMRNADTPEEESEPMVDLGTLTGRTREGQLITTMVPENFAETLEPLLETRSCIPIFGDLLELAGVPVPRTPVSVHLSIGVTAVNQVQEREAASRSTFQVWVPELSALN